MARVMQFKAMLLKAATKPMEIAFSVFSWYWPKKLENIDLNKRRES